MGASDEQCIERFLAGDPEGFSTLVTRYERAVMGLAMRLTGDAGAAEDLYQEIFIKVYRSVRYLRERSKFRAWLFKLATRHIRRSLRSRRNRPVVAGELVENVEDATSRNDTLEVAEQAAALRREVARLPPRQREVVMLRGFQGLSYAEVAGIVGGTQEGARANFYQALRRLREKMQGEDRTRDSDAASSGDRES